jgi:hypothetical protein
VVDGRDGRYDYKGSSIVADRQQRIFRMFAAAEILCVIFEQIWHVGWLPIGGSHCAQLGVLLGLAFVLNEFFDGGGGPGGAQPIQVPPSKLTDQKKD